MGFVNGSPVKILLDHSQPFLLAHGGFQTQIEQTHLALQQAGLEVEWLRWWDADQRCDVIHTFNRMPPALTRFAHQKGIKIVIAEILTGLGSRPASARAVQRLLIVMSKRFLPRAFIERMSWDTYEMADACVANTAFEAHLMHYMFGAPVDKVHVVPNGVEREFLDSPKSARGSWLVCTAVITERKRVVELAEAAIRAQTPVWFVGRPYSEEDDYYKRFHALCNSRRDLLRYEGAISDRKELAAVYRQARGFVLLSTQETRSLSAEEAAACECPILLNDLPWARSVFGDSASYCPVSKSASVTAEHLRRFHDQAPSLKVPARPKSWLEVGQQLHQIYESITSVGFRSRYPAP